MKNEQISPVLQNALVLTHLFIGFILIINVRLTDFSIVCQLNAHSVGLHGENYLEDFTLII